MRTKQKQVTLGILAALGMGPVPATLSGSPTADTAKVDEVGASKGAAASKNGHEHVGEEDGVAVPEERALVA